LKEKLTVSDSKKLFHEQFPYVIPGLYKRIVDEMLVELNLLNHQNEFMQDDLFCVGLTETFKELTKGYKPDEHLMLLFESLCNSSNFEPKKIKEISKKTLEEYKEKSLKEISSLLIEKSTSNLYSSRILNLGIYLIISNATDFKNIKDSEKNKTISDIFDKLNLSFNKAEKDIGIYKNILIRMEQAKELLQEARIKATKDKKK
jgi:photosystem II biogenesis protein Psp29